MEQILTTFNNCLQAYNEYVGGYAVLMLLVPAGIFFTFYLKGLQITGFRDAVGIISRRSSALKASGDISSYKALTTALSATVGTGNIVGVALAVHYGGPGAIFWLWVTGFLGMAIKLVESTLSQHYKVINNDGSVSGGPMYYMEKGLKSKLGKWAKYLAIIFSFATILATFGTGSLAQAHAVSSALQTSYGISPLITALVITTLVLLIIVGGLKRIANVTSRLVPFMAVMYLSAALLVIIISYKAVPDAFLTIFRSAFSGTAATGGFIGSTFIITLVWGVKRGLFSNEAGQGSSPITHAAAKTEYPIQEGLVASLEPLIDTIIICTMTGLVIILSGSWTVADAQGVDMTIIGFERGLEQIGLGFMARHVVSLGLVLFAFSTLVAWSYYGNRASLYLWGEKAIKPYYFVYGFFTFCGCLWKADLVWNFVDAAVSFMTIPNVIAILILAPVVKKEVEKLPSIRKNMIKKC